MDFKIGDKIRGKKRNGYGITNEKMLLGEVVKINDGPMNIKILKHISCSEVGQTYWVSNSKEDFDLILQSINKKDLQIGDKLILRDNSEYLLVDDGDLCCIKGDGCVANLDEYDDNLIYDYFDDKHEYDVVKIERPTEYIPLFNRTEEVKEMTLEEVCKELGYDVKIIKDKE